MSLSDKFAAAAQEWVQLDAAASILEETKSAVLSQWMAEEGDIAVNRAEANVKASPRWMDFVTKMVKAREAANKAKVRLEYIRMRHSEQQSSEATARAEMRL